MEQLTQQYLKMRKLNQFSVEWFYSYYLAKEKNPKGNITHLSTWLNTQNVEQIIKKLDRELGIDKLTDIDGKVIAYIKR